MVTQVVRAPLPQLSICPEERLDELQAAGAVNSLSCPTTRNKKSLIHGGVPKNSVMSICLVVSGRMFTPVHHWLAKMHRLSSKI